MCRRRLEESRTNEKGVGLVLTMALVSARFQVRVRSLPEASRNSKRTGSPLTVMEPCEPVKVVDKPFSSNPQESSVGGSPSSTSEGSSGEGLGRAATRRRTVLGVTKEMEKAKSWSSSYSPDGRSSHIL